MFEDLSRIIDHQLYLALKQSLEERHGKGTGSAAGGGGDGAGRRDGGDGEGDGGGTRSEEGSDGISAPPASDYTPSGRSPVGQPGGVEGGSRRSNSLEDWDRGRGRHREGDDAVVTALARLRLGSQGQDAYRLGGEGSWVRGGSSNSSGGGEDVCRGRNMLRRGRHRRRPYREEENKCDEDGDDDDIHENNWSPARAWEDRGGRKLTLRPFRPPAEEDEEDIYGATPLASPGALERRRDDAPPHRPVEEGDIYGTTPTLSARSPEGLHNILPLASVEEGEIYTSAPLHRARTSTDKHKSTLLQLQHPPIDKNIYKFGASQPPNPLRDPVPSQHLHPPHPPPPPAEPESEPTPGSRPPIPPTTNDDRTTEPPSPPLPKPRSDPPSTSFFPAITSLTLIAEDVPELVAFYTAVFADDAIDLLPGADAESASLTLGGGSTTSFSNLRFFSSSSPSSMVPGPLVVHLLSSREARRRRALGPGVHVGRRRDAGRRLLLGVRVRGLDGVYARLLALEKGGGRGGEEESGLGGGGVWPWGWGWRARKSGLVNELTGPAERTGPPHMGTDLGGRRSLMFWDPAGHCWEVWEDSPGRVS